MYHCNKCGELIEEKKTVYLHQSVGNLESNKYYCRKCVDKEIIRKEEKRNGEENRIQCHYNSAGKSGRCP